MNSQTALQELSFLDPSVTFLHNLPAIRGHELLKESHTTTPDIKPVNLLYLNTMS